MTKILLMLVFAFVLSGCYTAVGVVETEQPTTTVYTYGYGYYWGSWYNPYYPFHYYPRYYYVPPKHIHVPSYYEKHPQYKTRDFGVRKYDLRTPNPPPPKREVPRDSKPRQQGNRR